jgi:hypothetical protein
VACQMHDDAFGHLQSICADVQELKEAVEHMTSKRTQQLLLFQTSERYLSRLAAALQHKAGQEAKSRRYIC